jgi:type IV pilus assembly protein PilY1
MVLGLLGSGLAIAQTAIQAVPPNISPDPNLPMVTLNVSKDFSMFSRAYTDYEDLDFDGAIDYTFMPAFKYYGYFDSTKCYSYSSSGSGNFTPAVAATQDATGAYYCSAAGVTSSYWSGNFLNWATMSRMDVLRKILFGGLRSTDTATQTILELSFVPRNSQAFVKFYNGSDLRRLTPFFYPEGLTLCRRHQNPSSTTYSQSTTLLPVIRVARGDYMLWNMTEVRTCNWSGEINYTWKTPTVSFMTSNYQGAGGPATHKSGVPSSSDAGSAEYTARVEVCKSGLIGEENCKLYGTTSYKPQGLLNEFGESDNYGVKAAKAEFALLLGSFDSNLDGAVLRKNMSEINGEVNQTNGVFLTGASAGIIQALSKLRLYGYDLNGGNYSQTCDSRSITNGNCPSWGNPIGEIVTEGLRYYAGKTALYTSGTKDAEFSLPAPAWTDPLKVNTAYANLSTGVATGKTRTQLYGQNACRPLNMVTISSGVSTFDNDKVDSEFRTITTAKTVASLTADIGTQEGITATTRLVGNSGTGGTNNDLCTGKSVTDLSTLTGLCPEAPNMKGTYLGAGAAYWSHTNKIRTDITVPGNANAEALEVRQYAVSMAGGSASIQIPVPGSNPIRYVYITPASLDSLIDTNNPLAGNLVDFKVLNRSLDGLSGSFLVLWQHYMLGEDQDQDMLGSIRYVVDTSTTPAKLKIYTQTLESDTGSTVPFLFGYTLVGTGTTDGFHSHSAINGGYATDNDATYLPAQVTSGGGSDPNCNDPRKCVRFKNTRTNADIYVYGETLKTYTMNGSQDAVIRDPLWYIAKYGGFKDSTTSPTGKPDAISKWDTKRADGALCGGSGQPACADGIPDNYFLARRPDLLEDSLRQVFADITANSNSAPAVSRPDLQSGDFKYVATFAPADLHGEISSYKLNASGNFETSPSAKGHELMTAIAPDSRRIITNVGAAGVAFRYTSLSASALGTAGATYLSNIDSTGTSTSSTRIALQKARIDYLRGSRVDEGAGNHFRVRNITSIMGGVVNSNPWLQDIPSANFFGSSFAGYSDFKTKQKLRNKLVWVGASDAMLHAFESETLTPVMSYVPSPLSSRLKSITDPTVTDVQAYMDGSPFTADVTVGSTWKTYLFATLGRGGKGIYALDVTAPANSTTNSLTEANAASIFKWQFTSDDDAADLGYVLSEGGIHPVSNQASQVAKLPNGKFAVLFGNGVSSTSGKAVLYILFVDGPSTAGVWTEGVNYRKIVLDSGSGNGLMQPTWVDTDDDGIADTIYAGDLKGNMWTIDVSGTAPSTWGPAYGAGKPLYTAKDAAGNALPIAAAPAVRFHPNGGQVVVFGTGKSVVSGDFPDTSRSQRVFGIWDKPSYKTATSTIPTGLTDLVSRTWTVDSSTGAIVQGTVTSIDWNSKKGWYVDIPLSSGMVLSNLLYSTTSKDIGIPIVYKTAATGAVCNDNAAGAFVQIDAVNGAASVNIFGVTSSTGLVIGLTGLDQRFRLAEDSTARCTTGLNCQRIIGQNTDTDTKQNTTQSRIFWREIPGLKTTVESH